MVRFFVFASLLGLVAAPAAAQVIPDDSDGGAGSEIELDDDPPPATDAGDTDENPDAPRLIGEPDPAAPIAPSARATGYPVNEVLRPLTLPDFTSELRLDAATYPSPFDLEVAFRARYGITRQAQIGVGYGIGGLYNDGKRGKTSWNTGKAVEINFTFLAQDWVAPRIAVPMYVDPFAIGLVLGAPVKFRFGDRFALVGFEEVVGFKFQGKKFLPTIDSERTNEVLVDALGDNTISPDGYLRFDFGAVYQLEPDLALTGRFGFTMSDFSTRDAASALRVQLQWTPRRRVDLIGVTGFDRLDEAGNSFHLTAALAVRI
ncbi:MAG: hypothetical protein R3B06_21895 [Kofleriaceae bacterium]